MVTTLSPLVAPSESVLDTSVRLLRRLSLLQSRRERSGADLAERLEVTGRTVRNDIERLRILGYRVESRTGVVGGYRLGSGTAMPPLLPVSRRRTLPATSYAGPGRAPGRTRPAYACTPRLT